MSDTNESKAAPTPGACVHPDLCRHTEGLYRADRISHKDRMRGLCDHCRGWTSESESLRAENARLRGALSALLHATINQGHGLERACEIARAALRGENR